MSQASDPDGQPTLVGVFSGWNATRLPSLVTPNADLGRARPLWVYSGGEGCWEGPARSAQIELRCGDTTELAAVEEDGKCTYWFLLRTPHACEVPFEAEERAAIEVEVARMEAEQAAAEAAAAQEADKEAAEVDASSAGDPRATAASSAAPTAPAGDAKKKKKKKAKREAGGEY